MTLSSGASASNSTWISLASKKSYNQNVCAITLILARLGEEEKILQYKLFLPDVFVR